MSELLGRLLGRDPTLWPKGNVSQGRLGWLDIAERMAGEAADIRSWAASVDASTIVLVGMGGSSLGPEVLRAAVPSERLVVLDTTDPETVASVPVDDAFFVVSSKSGSTLEVNALLAHFWQAVPDGRRYAAITDPGTELAEVAEDGGFNRIYLNPPDIGGRYSVLSYFGLVPAALCGLDVGALCERAMAVDREAAVELGVAMGQAAREGRDKITIVVPQRFFTFGLWLEQLIAESTGKRGTGCIPVPTAEVELGPDRHLVALDVDDPLDLGGEFLRWEVATAVAGHVLEVDPFDEPNVAESKAVTVKMLEALPLPEVALADPGGVTEWLAAHVRPRDYVAIQAYLPYPWVRGGPHDGSREPLERLRRSLRDGLGGMAVTAGYGPRFLHSTGQLHKGGPDSVVALQLVRRTPVPSVPIPSLPYDLNTLISAQALGDHHCLLDHDRRVLRVGVDDLAEVR